MKIDGVRVGGVTGIVGDRGFERIIGFHVANGDRRGLFLPWIASRLQDGIVHAESSLALIDVGELESYARRGARIVRAPDDLQALTVSREGVVSRVQVDDEVSAPEVAGTPGG